MTDFTEWEGDQFEYEFQSWFDRNREAMERMAAQIGETMARLFEWFKDICVKLWEQLRIAAASAADAIRHLVEAYQRDWPKLPPFGVSGIPHLRRGRRRPPPIRDLRATAVRGPHTFRRY